MNEKQRENEEKIFKAIRDLKDSVFGLKQSYTPFCYTYDKEHGTVFNMSKMIAFSEELAAFGRETNVYRQELDVVLPVYFRVSLMLLESICSSSDWVFVSMRKLADTALKDSMEESSVLDRIISDYTAKIDMAFPGGEFWTDYDVLCKYMGQVDNESFFLSVKHALEAFLDEHRLNVLHRDSITDSIIARMSRLAATVERDLARGMTGEEEE